MKKQIIQDLVSNKYYSKYGYFKGGIIFAKRYNEDSQELRETIEFLKEERPGLILTVVDIYE